jgi:hypothetical protein
MGDDSHLGSDEFEVMVELIITIFFMTICAYYTSLMINKMNLFAELTYQKDKINVTSVQHEAHDPFYFDGYGSIMVAWCSDNQSTVPVVWLGSTSDGIESPDIPGAAERYRTLMSVPFGIDAMGADTENLNYAILGSTHDDGTPVNNFDTYKPQIIAGSNSPSSAGYYNNVLKAMRSVVNPLRGRISDTSLPARNSEKAALYNFYRGTLRDETYGKLVYHLEYTPDYTKTVDYSDYIERNRSQWVMVPKYRQ